MDYWLPNPRFPAGYKERLTGLAAERGCSVGSLIVNMVLEQVDSWDGVVQAAGGYLRVCSHPLTAPTRLIKSGRRVCWCGASTLGGENAPLDPSAAAG